MHLRKENILKIKITTISFYEFVLNIPILQIIRFTDMKVRLYAGDMNLNKKDEKKNYVEIQTFNFLEMFYSPTGYLARMMF